MEQDKFYKNPPTGEVQTGEDWEADLRAKFTLSFERPLDTSFLDAALVEVKWIKGDWRDQR